MVDTGPFGARYDDPEVGRFTSSDPAKDGLNWYIYCANNPLICVDPDGNTYVILWSYSSSELQDYKRPDGTVDWARFEEKVRLPGLLRREGTSCWRQARTRVT